MLFFAPTYFLAIPLILASAVYFKKYVALTVVYYALISVPLQILQYFNYTVSTIVQPDWWNAAGSSPPLFISLNSIFTNLNSSISNFDCIPHPKLFMQLLVSSLGLPIFNGRNLGDALSQYRDSAPGLIMFIIIVVGLALALIFFARLFIKEAQSALTTRFFHV